MKNQCSECKKKSNKRLMIKFSDGKLVCIRCIELAMLTLNERRLEDAEETEER